MSEQVQLVAALVTAAACIAIVFWLIWKVVRYEKAPAWTAADEAASVGEAVAWVDDSAWCTTYVLHPAQRRLLEAEGPIKLNLTPSRPRRAFDWPAGGEYLSAEKPVEPVRISFRSMLEGGPDYRG